MKHTKKTHKYRKKGGTVRKVSKKMLIKEAIRDAEQNFIDKKEEVYRRQLEEAYEESLPIFINKARKTKFKKDENPPASRANYNNYIKSQNNRRKREVIDKRMQSYFNKASRENLSIHTAYHKDSTRNPRLFFITGHSILCSDTSCVGKGCPKLTNIRTNILEDPMFSTFRLLSFQSIGRVGFTSLYSAFTFALKQNPLFHRSLVSTETDGDSKNLNLLTHQYLQGDLTLEQQASENSLLSKSGYKSPIRQKQYSDSNISHLETKYGTKLITDFNIYPKPKNPKLVQRPLLKDYYFHPTELKNEKGEDDYSDIIRGVFEITQIKDKDGLWKIDDFMVSDDLYNIFQDQIKDVKTRNFIFKIMTCMRIPDYTLYYKILNSKPSTKDKKYFYAKQTNMLQKLLRMNSINRQIFRDVFVSKMTPGTRKNMILALCDDIPNIILSNKIIGNERAIKQKISTFVLDKSDKRVSILNKPDLLTAKINLEQVMLNIYRYVYEDMKERKVSKTTPIDEVLILDNSCSTLDTLDTNLNQSFLNTGVAKIRPKRSNSATFIERKFMPYFLVTVSNDFVVKGKLVKKGTKVQISDDNDYWLQLYAKKFKASIRYPRVPYFFTNESYPTIAIDNLEIDFDSYIEYLSSIKKYGLTNRLLRKNIKPNNEYIGELLRLINLEEKKFDFNSKMFLKIID